LRADTWAGCAVTALLRALGSLPAAERPAAVGANELKCRLQAAWSQERTVRPPLPSGLTSRCRAPSAQGGCILLPTIRRMQRRLPRWLPVFWGPM